MNLLDYRTRISRVVGMSPTDAGDLALIDSWVNEGVVEFLKDAKVNVITASLTTTAASADYTLDDSILAFNDVWYSPADGSQSALMEPVDSREISRMRLTQNASSTYPRFYALSGAKLLQLYPTPTSSLDTIHMLYVPRPAALSATADSPGDATRGNIPKEYHPLIEAYAKWKAAEAEEHKPSQFGLAFQAEYQKGVAETRSDMNRKGGVFKARKVGGKLRGRRFPATPGTDLR